MWVCKECFADEEMRKEVENNSIDEGKCDVCGKTGKRCDLSVFADFFVSVFPLFKKDVNSEDTIISILERDWNVFLFSALFRDFSENRPYSCVRG